MDNEEELSKYKRGTLNDPDGIELFKVGKLKDSNPTTNSKGCLVVCLGGLVQR